MVNATGELRWGIRPSFMAYLAEADARFEVGDGASADLAAGLAFPVAGIPTELRSGDTIHAAGEVTIWAHGIRVLWLAQPSIALHATRAELQILRWAGREARATVATASAAAQPTDSGWEWADLVLAPTGVDLFGDKYPAGTELAPIRLDRHPAV